MVGLCQTEYKDTYNIAVYYNSKAKKRGIVINLCLGVDFAKSEDKEFCVVYSV